MSTDNNIPQEAVTQSINEQLIAVLRPVLHSLPLEVVEAAIPAEARINGNLVDDAAAKWVKETAPDQVLALMGPLSLESFPKEDIIAHVRRHYSKEIFEPTELLSLLDYEINGTGRITEEKVCDWVENFGSQSAETWIQNASPSEVFELMAWDSEWVERELVAALGEAMGRSLDILDLFSSSDISEFLSEINLSEYLYGSDLAEALVEVCDFDDIVSAANDWDVECWIRNQDLDDWMENFPHEDRQTWMLENLGMLESEDIINFLRNEGTDIQITDLYGDDQIMEWVTDNWYLPDLIDNHYDWSDALEAVITHASSQTIGEAVTEHFSFSEIADQYGQRVVKDYIDYYIHEENLSIDKVFSKTEIMNYVQCYEVTEWYHPEMIRRNLSPTDIWSVTQTLESLLVKVNELVGNQ